MLLTRPENLGARRDIGLDLSLNGSLVSTLRYSAGFNLFHQSVRANGIPSGKDGDAVLASGRFSLNWQPTRIDFVQLSGFWVGDTSLAQGRREVGGMLNFGYRRTLNAKLSLNLTGRDLLNSFTTRTAFNTPLFRDRSGQDIRLRAVLIDLTYKLGSAPRRQPEQFDFSTVPTEDDIPPARCAVGRDLLAIPALGSFVGRRFDRLNAAFFLLRRRHVAGTQRLSHCEPL